MRSLEFNVTTSTVTPTTAAIGNAGEHNVTNLKFKVSDEILNAVDYYRLSVGDYRSEKLFAQNSVVSYSLPRSVLQTGAVLLQLDGYKTHEGEIERVFKSELVTAEVGASVCTVQDIPSEMEKDVDHAIAELDALVKESRKAENIKVAVEKIAAQVEINRTKVQEETETVQATAEIVLRHKNRAEIAASDALKHTNKAESYATSAKADAEEAAFYCDKAREQCAEAVKAGGYIQAATEIDRNISVVYKKTYPDWIDHDVQVEPDLPGKETVVNIVLIEKETYLVRFNLTNQNANDTINVVLLSSIGEGEGSYITNMTTATYNQELGCYEARLVAKRNTAEDESIRLYVGYPFASNNTFDYTCEFGSADILYAGSFHSVVGKQNYKISDLSDEISAVNEGVEALSDEVSDLRGRVDDWSVEPKEIYKIENKGLGGLGGNETERLFSIRSELNVELKANEEYIFSIPRPLEDADAMELQTDVAHITLNYDGDRYTGLFIPKTDVSALVLEYLIVYGVSDYSGPIDLHIEHLSPMAKKFGDIETALDNIIDIQNNLIGGEG